MLVATAHAARLALVIGNDQYQTAPTLKNARNDARLIASTLKDAGYEVVGGVRENLGEKAMWRAIDQFAQRVQSGDEVAFFFAGHGVQLRDTVLLPVDIQPDNADQVERDGVPLGALQDKLSRAKFALLIIDACRDNPFPPRPGTRSLGETRGLAPPASVARGSAVLLAANRGQKALDYVPGGTQGNGLFTHELNALLRTPGLGVISAARTVRDRVEARAGTVGHQQRPTLVDDVSGDYVLFPAQGGGTLVVSVVPEAAPAQLTAPAPQRLPYEPEMVRLPAGSFQMGSPQSERDQVVAQGLKKEFADREAPQRRVSVRAFDLGKTEVTQGQWKAVMGSNPSNFSQCGDNCPVEQVSWNDIQEYLRKLNQITGQRYRLPSEAEWEYAARAGCESAFNVGGQCAHKVEASEANFGGNYTYNGSAKGVYREKTTVVGSFKANNWGLSDMHGNVLEWVQDCFEDDYSKGQPSDGSAHRSGDSACSRRVLRGGSWNDFPQRLRSAIRSWGTPANRNLNSGFRLARTVP